MQEWCADLDQLRTKLPGKKTRERRLKLRIREEEQPLSGKLLTVPVHGDGRPIATLRCYVPE